MIEKTNRAYCPHKINGIHYHISPEVSARLESFGRILEHFDENPDRIKYNEELIQETIDEMWNIKDNVIEEKIKQGRFIV